MEISTRDWVVALMMIQRLQQTCMAFEEMFGKLTVYLKQAGLSAKQIRALNEEWDRSCRNNIEELSAQEGFVHRITGTGVDKRKKIKTLEDVFDDVRSEALERFESEMGEET